MGTTDQPKRIAVKAPAKVNLTLHVTGKRDDGYHLLDSLVAFAPVVDFLTVEPSEEWALVVSGPEAEGVPNDERNLVHQAAKLLDLQQKAKIFLEKHLPVASGIGGGSADAAAALKAMMLWSGEASDAGFSSLLNQLLGKHADSILGLGADVPMCMLSRTCRAEGIGEQLTLVDLPRLPAVLVNPRRQVATPHVFSALGRRPNAPMSEVLPKFETAIDLIEWLREQRNDLERPAIRLEPVIKTVLDAIQSTKGCRLARMSGSGATCFGLYDDEAAAKLAASGLSNAHPDWWVTAGVLGDQSQLAVPELS